MTDIANLVVSTAYLPSKPRCRSLGIVLAPTRIDVEEVGPRHTKPCLECSSIPIGYRLMVNVGSGMRAKSVAYCRTCGANFLRLRLVDIARGIRVLETQRSMCVRHALV